MQLDFILRHLHLIHTHMSYFFKTKIRFLVPSSCFIIIIIMIINIALIKGIIAIIY